MAWFKPKKMVVPILPDSFGEDDPDVDQDLATPRASPKAIFDGEAIREHRPATAERTAFTVHASKNGEINEIHQNSPTLTVAKARGLYKSGWQVHIADAAGRRYAPPEFDDILKFDR